MSSPNALRRLADHGQSYWLDSLDREMIRSGALAARVREDALRGITSNPSIDATLEEPRVQVRTATRSATTLGYGPRSLYSTGQLHKGGPDAGLFVILSLDDGANLDIPDTPHGFHDLHRAQAEADLRTLTESGRRAVRIHLGTDLVEWLDDLLESARGAAATAVRT